MDKAKPGHTVKFTGLKGAAHLNGTRGTLVKFLKKDERWSVRREDDPDQIVNAKPENLVLQHLGRQRTTRGPERAGGPTVGGVMSAGVGANTKEEYYLRTLMAVALQAEAANGGGSSAQDLVADAIGALVDRGELDGEAGEAFVANLHRRMQQESSRGNMHEAEIMGFMDTVLLTKLLDRRAKLGRNDGTVPTFLKGSLAGALSYNQAMRSGHVGHASTEIAAEVTQRQDMSLGC